MSEFINQKYLFDKPQKWDSPTVKIFIEEDIEYFSYMQFNGVYTGNELLSLYKYNKEKIDFLENEVNYVIFSIPEEDYYCEFTENKNSKEKKYIPLHNICEIIIFKIWLFK